MLRVMLWGTVVASLLAAFVVARLSLAVRRADQYPLPGARLLQDTVVRRGPAAARFAHAGFVVAALLVLAAFTLAWSGLRMLGMLAAAAPG
jgi:hypothetical protein